MSSSDTDTDVNDIIIVRSNKPARHIDFRNMSSMTQYTSPTKSKNIVHNTSSSSSLLSYYAYDNLPSVLHKNYVIIFSIENAKNLTSYTVDCTIIQIGHNKEIELGIYDHGQQVETIPVCSIGHIVIYTNV